MRYVYKIAACVGFVVLLSVILLAANIYPALVFEQHLVALFLLVSWVIIWRNVARKKN